MAEPDLPLHALPAAELARRLRAGHCSAEAVLQSCLERIAAVEPVVQAWAHFDAAQALAQARAADRRRAAGEPLGPLHGVPVGLKDIIDTADFPTENGTVLHAGRRPARDAVVVQRLRAAGAIIPGKTVTTELATYAPGKTRNPHDPAHTPGGSSSGSAAAVAAQMLPLAVGTQTNGSVIRPAAFCGVYGYKPTFGLIPRTGVLRQSRALDQVGVFGRTLEDVAWLAELLVGGDAGDPDAQATGPLSLRAAAVADPGPAPRLAFMATPVWERAAPDTQAAFDGLRARLGPRLQSLPLPEPAAAAWDWQRTVMEAEMAVSYDAEWAQRALLSPSLQGQLARGRAIALLEYQHALAQVPRVNAAFNDTWAQYDAILTPAVAATAPRGLESTGDPAFCTLWTYCGMPALNLPLLQGANGLPLGVQLVGPRGADARLLRAACWLVRHLAVAG